MNSHTRTLIVPAGYEESIRQKCRGLLLVCVALLLGLTAVLEAGAQAVSKTVPERSLSAFQKSSSLNLIYTYENTTQGTLSAQSTCSGTELQRTFNVGDAFTINDLNVGLNLSHTSRGDLRVRLTSPRGTTVTLIELQASDRRDNFDLLLDDSSNGQLHDGTNDNTGNPKYGDDRTAVPDHSLSAFNGQNASGTWTLAICNFDTQNKNLTYRSALLEFDGSASAVSGQITGTAFRDFNANGEIDAFEPGVPGITVTAYDAARSVVDQATTDSDGAYTLDVPDDTEVRIEFTGAPDFLFDGAVGTDAKSSVAFATSPASGVDMSLNNPAQYCGEDPRMIAPCFINGDPLGGASSGTADAVVSFPYTASGKSMQGGTRLDHDALGLQVGAVWGVGYQRTTQRAFIGAMTKRHAGFGPLGTGGIYVIDYSNPLLTTVSNWLDLNSQSGIITGYDSHVGLPIVVTGESRDANVFDDVGKSSLGDLDVSEDETTLYVMNLYERELIAIDIASKAVTATYPVGNPGCASNSDVRPWGIGQNDGEVYIGVVCSAQSSQNDSDLKAYVLRLSGSSFVNVINFRLDYTKGEVWEYNVARGWYPWISSYNPIPGNHYASGSDGSGIVTTVQYPQPILGDISFDETGSMTLSFVDRFSHQGGWRQPHPTQNNNNTYAHQSGGDIIRVCKVGSSYVLEGESGCSLQDNNNEGPNGGEFYDDLFVLKNHGPLHYEINSGGSAVYFGTGEVAGTAMDPDTDTIGNIAGGVRWWDNLSGAGVRNYEIYHSRNGNGRPTANFGKSGGLGDLELVCEVAPLEIGNRVWLDEDSGTESADNNGVQDPGEPGISGVTVNLVCEGGWSATTMTAGDGSYLFRDGVGNIAFWPDARIPRNAVCEVRIDPDQAALADYSPSVANVDEDIRDSDGVTLDSGFFGVEFAIGSVGSKMQAGDGSGENNHSYDFGFGSAEVTGEDFGDAPNTYGTILGSNGPRHVLVSGFHLGTCVDSEANGQNSSQSDADNLNAGASKDGFCGTEGDEDGVAMPSANPPIAGGIETCIAVTASAAGKLDAWIDFHSDGNFDTTDRIFNGRNLAAGSNNLCFTPPMNMVPKTTFARFRFSSVGGLTPKGPAADGEVEDYMISFALPVELTGFTAQVEQDDEIRLNWTTASETQNAGFEIQQRTLAAGADASSEEGTQNESGESEWETVAFVEGAGTTTEARTYSYRLTGMNPGTHRFRLKQVDLDGGVQYSPVVEAKVEVPGKYVLLSAYPNPFREQTSMQFSIREEQTVTMRLFDMRGREVGMPYTGRPEPGGMHTVTVDGHNLPSGLYMVRLEGETFTAVQKIMLVR